MSSVELIRKPYTRAAEKSVPFKWSISTPKELTKTSNEIVPHPTLETLPPKIDQKSPSDIPKPLRKKNQFAFVYWIVGFIIAIIAIGIYIRTSNKFANQMTENNVQENSKSNIFKVQFSISPSGAEVFFDSEKIGTTPLEPIEKEEGQYRIEIRKKGYGPYYSNSYIKNERGNEFTSYEEN